MNLTRRRLVQAGIGLLVLAAVLGVLLQTSTRQALERAEALQFRRMLVSQVADDGGFRFFYATNRQRSSAAGAVVDAFGNQRLDQLSFGRFDTEIEPTLGIEL